MRVIEVLIENSLVDLKNKVKSDVDKTNDENLLNQIYAKLNSGTLIDRLTGNLEKLPDPEIRTYLDEIANAILSAPGTYDEKIEFINGLHTGYVDVEKMTDGERHHFSDLLKPTKKVPLKFLFQIFNAMRDLGSSARKGPGEFALAILSPHVSIFGSGDLKIGNRIIEVKAKAGTIGDTSMFQHQKVAPILKSYIPNLNTEQAIGPGQLVTILSRQGLPDDQLRDLADKLVNYIFKAQPWANIQPLKDAISNINKNPSVDAVRKGYLTAAYSAYKQKADKSRKFDGVMLMNFERQELRYFEDPEELYNDVDAVQFSFYHPNASWGGKRISPSVTLKAEPIDKVSLSPNPTDSDINARATYLIRSAQQRNPMDLDLRDPSFKNDVIKTIKDFVNLGYSKTRIQNELFRKYPKLKSRTIDASNPTPSIQPIPEPAPAANPVNPTPPKTPSKSNWSWADVKESALKEIDRRFLTLS